MAWKFMGKRWVFLFGAVFLASSSHAMAASVSYADGDGTSTTATGSLLAASVSSESAATSTEPVLFSAGGSASLTGGSTPNVVTRPPGVAGDGVPDVIYDPATGDIQIRADGKDLINSFSFISNSSKFTGTAPNFPGTTAAITSDFDDEITRSGFSPPFTATTLWNLGNVAATGLDFNFLKSDLTIVGNSQGGSQFNYDLVVTGVPEPTSIGLLGLGAIGLLARRRRIAKRA